MNDILVPSDLQHVFSIDIANHYQIVPLSLIQNVLEVGSSNAKISEQDKDELELLTGYEIKIVFTESEIINKALSSYYRKERVSRTQSLSLERTDFLEQLLEEAQQLKCSDIHFEIYEVSSRIRFRIDGQLIERYKIDKENYLELVNKIKIRAKLNITEKRLPQDGRITNDAFDIRVSILPTLYGEKIVMRLLGQDATAIDLKTLGFSEEELSLYLEYVQKPNGIILISGPTGSGKTTTLYATLRLLNNSIRNILTVEDPIEYTLKGINQVQLKEDIGLTFASALRSFLRQDPDIIMLGEIRDSETALMAIRASLTGHLVLSTIHTNSAVGTVSRLVDMGVPSYLLAETLNLSLAQRLVRKLCSCKEQVTVDNEDFPLNFKLPFEIEKIYKPVGCNNCFHTGYKGRTAIYEIIPITYENALSIKNNTFDQQINKQKKFKTLSEKAFQLLADGVTSLDEIYPILITL
jgi:type IV pilus assembly protein PilB